jgi:macrolide-specific efflux system membrane fusion protein
MLMRKLLTWMSSHKMLSAAAVIILSLTIAGATFFLRRSSGTLSDPLKMSTIIQSVYGIGTVTALRSYQIKPGVISTIDDIYVEEGDEVKKGDKLIKIESSIYRAPFDGTITSLPFRIGENIFSQTPILSLVNLTERYLVVSLEQQGALRVLRGQRAIISFDSLRDQNYDGIVESVYSSDSNFLARINVSSLPKRILPDMTADVAITLTEKTNVLVVPVEALVNGHIWIKRGKALPKLTKISTGIVDSAFAEVISGDVRVGDRVLLKVGTAK